MCFLCGLLGGEPITGGVGVAFEEASHGVDYCVLFHGIELKFEFEL